MGWNSSTQILTAPFTKIALNGQGDLQNALGRTTTYSEVQLLADVDANGNDVGKQNKWARYKSVPMNVVMAAPFTTSIHNAKTSSHSVDIEGFSGTRTLENAVGTQIVQTLANDSPQIYFWDMYGIRIPVLRGTNANAAATVIAAIDYLSTHPALNWPRYKYADWPASCKILRALDMDGYATEDIVSNPFEHTITDGYSDEGPTIFYQFDNRDYVGHQLNLTNILDVLANGITNWKLCIILKPATGTNYIVIERAIDSTMAQAGYDSWISDVVSVSTNTNYKAYFCIWNTTASPKATILIPSDTNFPNPASLVIRSTTNPAKNPFLSGLDIVWDNANCVERYSQPTGSSISLNSLRNDDTTTGIYSNGRMLIRLYIKNNSAQSKTFNLNNLTFYFAFRGATYPFSYVYEGTSSSATSTREFTLASGASKVLSFEFIDAIRSTDGLISSLAGGADMPGGAELQYNGTTFNYFEICYQYTSGTNSGAIFDWNA